MAIISTNEQVEELWVTRIGVAPVFIAALLPFIIGVVVLLKCVFNHCCVRKSTTKEELFGVEGRMTILSNADREHPPSSTNHTLVRVTNVGSQNNNNSRPCSSISMATGSSLARDSKKLVNQLQQSATPDTVDGNESFETIDLTDSLRATVKRQLPAPPQSPNHAPRRSSSMLSQEQDGTSELYATVDEVPGTKNSILADTREHLYAKVIKPKLAKGKSLGDQPSTSKGNAREPNPSSDSETYATSLNNSNHPYAKIKRPNSIEHPYAKVGTASSRIRTESQETAGDDAEETDTDNYDVANPYAHINKARADQARGSHRSANGGADGGETSNGAASSSQPSTSAQSSRRRSSPEPNQADDVPVPPRRIGRQWRRGSNPQANAAAEIAENQATFSGDSQESRGYSHLSVREPLSTIKAQTKKSSDPNYAFMSDDSEEMYAAIEDPSDANYMSIDRPSRLGPNSLISPIPERREANSPLPPPPLASPPAAAPAESPLAAPTSGTPAIYAQVTKRKKNKAPPTPATDTNSHPPPVQHAADTLSKPKQKLENLGGNTSVAQLATAESEPRRWSKADISYSEFEVIRESIFPSSSSGAVSTSHSHKKHKSFNGENYASIGPDALLDEDNYNIIPEPRGRGQPSKPPVERHSTRHEAMYQEIDEVSAHGRGKYPYQEMPPQRSLSTSNDHYAEIGSGSNRRRKRNKSNEKKTDSHASNIYQRVNAKTTEGEDSDDEDEDGFYEKVKAKPRPQDKPPISSTTGIIDKKHGYEKLKRKPAENHNNHVNSANANISDDDDDGFYEKVKCAPKPQPPEQNQRHNANSHHQPSQSSSHTQPQSVHGANTKSAVNYNHNHSNAGAGRSDDDVHNAEVDQLYARVDKTRKKRPEPAAAPHAVDNGKAHGPTPTSTPKAQSSKGHGHAHGASNSNNDRRNEPILTLTKDVTIEYI